MTREERLFRFFLIGVAIGLVGLCLALYVAFLLAAPS